MIGIGLIGSSVALCLKGKNKELRIVGFSENIEELIGAYQHKIIDDYTQNFKQACEQADVIFFCTPVSITLSLMPKIVHFNLKKNVLITDVGSTKGEILETAKEVFKNKYDFIGGHPMAGSHKSGFIAADINLFENAYYILVPNDGVSAEKVAQLKSLLRLTKAKFIELDASEHDKMTGILSHMPHIIASQLVTQADNLMEELPMAKKLAAGGFRDITRIASSNPKMWVDISISNRYILIEEIERWINELGGIKVKLATGDRKELYQFFEEAKKVRDEIPVHKEGVIPGFYDLYVNVPDYPGAIAEVTSILAKEKISLINIKIMETRDDIFGILRISFKNEKDLMQAKSVISTQSVYTCMIS
ncbi:MAG TPA: prephenate dehydrogenase [Vagococcus sp.]|nr:prephenate dehydrogenase [Vagococcus sp.]